MENFTLIVEGDSDKIIVEAILAAAKIGEQVNVLVGEGKEAAEKLAQKMLHEGHTNLGLLIDLDIINIPDAKDYIEDNKLKNKGIEIFFAVPEIETWLFADIDLALKNAKNKSAEIVLKRMALPEEIPHPKLSAEFIFRNYKTPYFIKDINISKAVFCSPSLHNFLIRLGEVTGIKPDIPEEPISRNLDRRVFANLLKEVLPSDKVIFKTMRGRYTTQDILDSIKNNTELSREYTDDLLRIARDFLMRQANSN